MDFTLRELERRALDGDRDACALYVAALKRSTAELTTAEILALGEVIRAELKSLEFTFCFGTEVILPPNGLESYAAHFDKERTLQEHYEEIHPILLKSHGHLGGTLEFWNDIQNPYFSVVEECKCGYSVIWDGCRCDQTVVDASSLPKPGTRYYLRIVPLGTLLSERWSPQSSLPVEPTPSFTIRYGSEIMDVRCGENISLHAAMQQSAPFMGYDRTRPLIWTLENTGNIITGDTIGVDGVSYAARESSLWS